MNDGRYVVDASVVLAVLRDEPVRADVETILETAAISAVNLSEVVAKLQDGGVPDARIDSYFLALKLDVVAFDAKQAEAAGKLRAMTRSAGLSLGDRACLALAAAEGATVITMDRIWATLDLPVTVEVARP